MATLTYTSAECIEAIVDIRAAMAELRRVPVAGEVRNTIIDLRGKLNDLVQEEQMWIDRLASARRGEGYRIGPRRREVF